MDGQPLDMQVLHVRAQFTEMMTWLQRGWTPAPPGRTCPECAGPVWLKEERRCEMHRCVYCSWGQDYQV